MSKMTPIEALQAICDAHKFNTASLLPHQVHEIAQSALDAYQSEGPSDGDVELAAKDKAEPAAFVPISVEMPPNRCYVTLGFADESTCARFTRKIVRHGKLYAAPPAERARMSDIDKRILAAFRAVGTWAGPNLTLAIERELGATVFTDNGDDIEARMSYAAEHACPTCGGSGHKDDVTVVGETIDILASYLDDGGHHGEADNVRNGTDLESYEIEFRLIDWILHHCKASSTGG